MLCISRDCLDNITEVVLSSRESLYILCLLIMCIFMTICRTYFTLCIICWHEIHSLLTSCCCFLVLFSFNILVSLYSHAPRQWKFQVLSQPSFHVMWTRCAQPPYLTCRKCWSRNQYCKFELGFVDCSGSYLWTLADMSHFTRTHVHYGDKLCSRFDELNWKKIYAYL